MKKPDEIKKGLEMCPKDACGACAYEAEWFCMDDLKTDALAYIQQLETERNQLLTKCERLERERDAAVSELVGTCQVCRWKDTAKCANCIFNEDVWNAYEGNWEWREECQENAEKPREE